MAPPTCTGTSRCESYEKKKQAERARVPGLFHFFSNKPGTFCAVFVQHVCPFRACSERYRCSWCIWCWREVQQLVSCPSSCGCRAWHSTKAVPLSGRWGICGCPSALEADGMEMVRVGHSGNCAACQAICLVQYSDVWSNLASTLSDWPVQRACLPETRQFACFVSCGWPMCVVSCTYSLWFILCLHCIMGGLIYAIWCINPHTPQWLTTYMHQRARNRV